MFIDWVIGCLQRCSVDHQMFREPVLCIYLLTCLPLQTANPIPTSPPPPSHRVFIPKDVAHNAKEYKLHNCAVVSLTLQEGVYPESGDTGYRVDPDSIGVVHLGFEKVAGGGTSGPTAGLFHLQGGKGGAATEEGGGKGGGGGVAGGVGGEPTAEVTATTMEGWLMKQPRSKGVFSRMQRRFFRLDSEGPKLTYFKDKCRVRTDVPLKTFKAVTHGGRDSNQFILMFRDRPDLVLKADTEREASDWIERFRSLQQGEGGARA